MPARQDAARPAAPEAGPEEEPEVPGEEPVSSTGTSAPTSRPSSSRPPTSSSSSPPPPPPPPPAPENGTAPNGPPWPQPHDYTQEVWFTWGKKELNVLVLGVKDPVLGATIDRAIASWRDGLAVMAPDLGLKLNVRWADTVPPGTTTDILVVPQGFMAVHPGVASRCTATAYMFFGTSSALHTAAHEFGHCLGQGHVFEHGVEYKPDVDIMGGGISGHISCPSNLNVAVIRLALAGETGELGIPAGMYTQAAKC